MGWLIGVAVIGGWTVIAVLVGIVTGRSIRLADEKEGVR